MEQFFVFLVINFYISGSQDQNRLFPNKEGERLCNTGRLAANRLGSKFYGRAGLFQPEDFIACTLSFKILFYF